MISKFNFCKFSAWIFFWITRIFFSIEQFSKQNIISVFFFWLYSERVKKLEASNTSKQFLSDHKFWILQSDRAPTPMTSNSFVYFYFPFVRSAFCKKKYLTVDLVWLSVCCGWPHCSFLVISSKLWSFTVQVFYERHKIWRKLPVDLTLTKWISNQLGYFVKSLWSS